MSTAESTGPSRSDPVTGMARIGSRVVALAVFSVVACGTATMQSDAARESRLSEEAVWRAVEARNSTWREDDFAGHMALYHPDFRRWALREPTLMTKSDFAGFWNAFKRSEEVISLEVQPEEVVFYGDGDVAIAHYTIHETWKSVRTGDIHSGSLRFSDVWVYVDGRWLYAGGHRDGMGLRRGQ